MSTSTRPSFLNLPPEIRQDIFIAYFQSITLYRRDKDDDSPLSILQACRLIYHEATPLVLPNMMVSCGDTKDMLRILSGIGPERLPEIRHMIIHAHYPVSFKLFSKPGAADGDSDGRGQGGDESDDDSQEEAGSDDDTDNDDDWDAHPACPRPPGTRFFQLGALLGLFPGLQLDLLEVKVYSGDEVFDLPFQNVDCLGSILETDGYRRFWMDAQGDEGGASWAVHMPSTGRWGRAIEGRFKPYKGGRVRIQVDGYTWGHLQTETYWKGLVDAGVTFSLIGGRYGEDAESEGDVEESDDEDEYDYTVPYGHEDYAKAIANRGDAPDIAVKDDGRVLRCTDDPDNRHKPPGYHQRASDALRKLFGENTWEEIEAMDIVNCDVEGMDYDPDNAYKEW